MCGIVGLLLKDRSASPPLGELLVPMFDCMAERGPDSAGLAVFGAPLSESSRRYSLFAPDKSYDWLSFTSRLSKAIRFKCGVAFTENHATIGTDADVTVVSKWLTENEPALHVLSAGRSIDVYKDEGHPLEIARRYRFSALSGTHCVGHTRMATESAVSPAHAHPFTAGEDFCLVHNGSLSNPYMLRRKLERQGLIFETDNDTEAACRFIEWRLRQGDSIHQALEASLRELDGFYTLLIATAHEMTLVRDAFACKPAVVAETDQYVAISSEFRSLAHLPGVADAHIFEPLPEEIYTWSV